MRWPLGFMSKEAVRGEAFGLLPKTCLIQPIGFQIAACKFAHAPSYGMKGRILKMGFPQASLIASFQWLRVSKSLMSLSMSLRRILNMVIVLSSTKTSLSSH